MPRSYDIKPRTISKNGCRSYMVTTPKDLATGRMKRRFFSSKEAAVQWCAELMAARGNISSFWFGLSVQDQQIIIGLVTSANGARALAEIVEIGKRHACGSIAKTVPVAVDEFIAAKKLDGLSEDWMRAYDATLKNQFAEDFKCNVADLRSPAIDDWLRKTVHLRTRNNKRGQLMTFLRWLQAREMVSPEIQWRLTRANIHREEPSILTPDQMRLMFEFEQRSKSRREMPMVPYLAIGAFAGLRTKEIQRLDWSAIDFDRGLIHVGIEVVKRHRSAKPRIIPAQPNLLAWLQPYAKEDGPVVRQSNLSGALLKLAKSAKVDWHKNQLRHSYTSYRVAVTQNEAQVATEIGDLVSTMKRHYKQAVDPEIGEKWFGIMPA